MFANTFSTRHKSENPQQRRFMISLFIYLEDVKIYKMLRGKLLPFLYLIFRLRGKKLKWFSERSFSEFPSFDMKHYESVYLKCRHKFAVSSLSSSYFSQILVSRIKSFRLKCSNSERKRWKVLISRSRDLGSNISLFISLVITKSLLYSSSSGLCF